MFACPFQGRVRCGFYHDTQRSVYLQSQYYLQNYIYSVIRRVYLQGGYIYKEDIYLQGGYIYKEDIYLQGGYIYKEGVFTRRVY